MKSLFVLLALVGSAFSNHFTFENPTTPGQYCIILDANVSGTIKYLDKLNKTQAYDFVINNTSTSSVSGLCFTTHLNQTAEVLNIAFYPNDITPPIPKPEPWNLTLYFGNQTGKSFELIDYELLVHFYDSFNATADSTTYTKAQGADLEWAAEEKNGFSCSSSGLSLTNESTVQFKDIKVVAFALLNNDSFPATQTFEQCKLDVRTSDIVPIIVGACLAGLVVIVLIAYLIGRARAKRQGYASV